MGPGARRRVDVRPPLPALMDDDFSWAIRRSTILERSPGVREVLAPAKGVMLAPAGGEGGTELVTKVEPA